MNILALDTATEACSVALRRADGAIFSEFEIAPRQHTRLLPIMMNAVLNAAQCTKSSITHCAFSNGPGAFTGVRIAAATAQGIGIALKVPLVPISTLATLAQVGFDQQADGSILVALDARLDEVYWAVYQSDDDGLACLSGTEHLSKICDVNIDASVKRGIGHGWLVGQPIWQSYSLFTVDTELLPHACSLLKLAARAVRQAQTCTAAEININYLRHQVTDR